MNDNEEFLTLEEALATKGLYSIYDVESDHYKPLEMLLVLTNDRSDIATASSKAIFVWNVGGKWTLHPYYAGSKIDKNLCKYKLRKTQHLEFSITLKTNEG